MFGHTDNLLWRSHDFGHRYPEACDGVYGVTAIFKLLHPSKIVSNVKTDF